MVLPRNIYIFFFNSFGFKNSPIFFSTKYLVAQSSDWLSVKEVHLVYMNVKTKMSCLVPSVVY